MSVPVIGERQVPELTLAAADHISEEAELNRTSYFAGLPRPSLTSVNDKEAPFDVGIEDVKSDTVPGAAPTTVTITVFVDTAIPSEDAN